MISNIFISIWKGVTSSLPCKARSRGRLWLKCTTYAASATDAASATCPPKASPFGVSVVLIRRMFACNGPFL